MSIYLRGVQVFMSQHFLKSAYIYTVLQHESRGGVAQFVSGVFAAVQPGSEEALFEHVMYPSLGDPSMFAGDEQGIRVDRTRTGTHLQPVVDSVLTGSVEVDHPFLVPLAQHTHTILADVRKVEADQFRDTDTAIQKKRYDAEIPFCIVSFDGFQQPDALV